MTDGISVMREFSQSFSFWRYLAFIMACNLQIIVKYTCTTSFSVTTVTVSIYASHLPLHYILEAKDFVVYYYK